MKKEGGEDQKSDMWESQSLGEDSCAHDLITAPIFMSGRGRSAQGGTEGTWRRVRLGCKIKDSAKTDGNVTL